MQTKYFKAPEQKESIFILTETQLRDYEIVVSFRTMKSFGVTSYEALNILATTYMLSLKTIEGIVYPIYK